MIADAQSGKIIATVPVGDHCDGVVFDPVYKRAYSSNGDGTLTVVREKSRDTFTVIENVVTQKGARTIALDGKTHHLFLPTAEFGPAPAPTAENPKPRPPIKSRFICDSGGRTNKIGDRYGNKKPLGTTRGFLLFKCCQPSICGIKNA